MTAMRPTYDPRDYGSYYAASKPSPVFGMSRLQLARWAFDLALVALKADAAAGRIQADAALLRFNALRGAYRKRKEAIEFRSWLAARGLENIVRAA